MSAQNLVIELDLRDVDTAQKLYTALNNAFGFFSGFGNNGNAVLDCLSSIYYGEQSLCQVTNNCDSETILEFVFYTENKNIILHLLDLITGINQRLTIIGLQGRYCLRPILPIRNL
ncbi:MULTISPECIES: barstar family protein [unclassified Bartonella]|uniref:barstar family protein n=1 Tax=unclassified Bartonella TaxID=2645622 RepID=UPI0015FCB03F|nr:MULTISPECIES: barstar family protein [unclassified Bartonella]UXN04998.1 barstar family protein [Bartonella sp. HY406]